MAKRKRQEGHSPKRAGTPLQRRLFAFCTGMSGFLVVLFAVLLLAFGINGSGREAAYHFVGGELSHLDNELSADLGRLSVQGIALSEQLSANADSFWRRAGMAAGDLQSQPQQLEPLLAAQVQTMKGMIGQARCSGVFLLLDATVNPALEGAESSRAGLFLIKTQPSAVDAVGSKLHYLRGPAEIARENGVELLGQWRMEFDLSEVDCFKEVMNQAREQPETPLSRLYRWSGRVSLKGNSGSGILLCVPLRSEDGTVFGVCGFEMSDRLFKLDYSPNSDAYTQAFAAIAPVEDGVFHIERGMIAGNYYLTSMRMERPLSMALEREGFFCYTDGSDRFGGLHSELKLYPDDSPYGEQKWALAVMLPQTVLARAVKGNSSYLLLIVLLLFGLSFVSSIFISRRYLRPVTEALNRIKSRDYGVTAPTPYVEINDLMEFLAQQEEARGQEVAAGRITGEMPPLFEQFLGNVKTLSKAERKVFDLYIEGYHAQEIAEELHLSINTIKTHNRRIFAKLNVSTRKELLVYLDMMRELDMIGKG
ncbi:helix-turn-helix transcriptional regulator [Bittarella massiliensis (ex Durand et al. 2017)]|uniref:helix-turn-helix transcriptional regulator n=1 Tax=Bittarella massiliensis (ex Durand et al. 2017) TaxID=1720313 RepID=UPI001AA0F4EE|nr:hypothetical protein [Bittarella massiliensis (ex Durand et al. 2017)]